MSKQYWVSKNHVMTKILQTMKISHIDGNRKLDMMPTIMRSNDLTGYYWLLYAMPQESESWSTYLKTDKNASHLEFHSSKTGNTYIFDLVDMQYQSHRKNGIWKIGNDTYQYSKEDDCWTFGGNKIKFNVESTETYQEQELHYGYWMYIKPDSTLIIANHPFKTCPHTSELTFTVDSLTLSANWHEND